MAQYAAETAPTSPAVSSVADPIPLGMSAFAFTTAILGCTTFAGFILPGVGAGSSLVVAAALFYGGIVQILAGMWEFRKDNTLAATIFSSYGGFLVAFGVVFLPGFGIFQALNGAAILHPALGLFFLCWTIFSGVLFLGSLKTNLALLIVLLLMFVSYLFLTIGELAGDCLCAGCLVHRARRPAQVCRWCLRTAHGLDRVVRLASSVGSLSLPGS